jgi:hypothetical protein
MAKKSKEIEESSALECGLVMPISAMDSYSTEHWVEVKSIINDAVKSITEYTFNVQLVSDADDVGVIQKRIVQNLYHSDIVICDVSGKNPNVMFELGMRLAFDKPTIIIKDNITGYSFDTGVIEHLEYPKDLRFSRIVEFKAKLVKSILATYKKSIADPEHSTFLKNFGEFKVAQLTEKTVSSDEMILSMLNDMQTDIRILKRKSRTGRTIVSSKTLTIEEKIRRAIKSYSNKHGIEEHEINFNDDFFDYVEKEIDAPSLFDDEDEFRALVSKLWIPF